MFFTTKFSYFIASGKTYSKEEDSGRISRMSLWTLVVIDVTECCLVYSKQSKVSECSFTGIYVGAEVLDQPGL